MSSSVLKNHSTLSMASTTWSLRTADPDLLAQGINVWRVDLDITQSVEEQLTTMLDQEEVERARRFHRAEDRRRFIASHGALRLLLAQLLEATPTEVVLARDFYGKPTIGGRHSHVNLQFNMAHSYDVALIAVGREQTLGVDIEHLRPMQDVMALAARFFSQAEIAQLRTVAGTSLELQCFFRCWTRKEAIVKGLGDGLSYRLNSFSVTLLPDERATVTGDESPGAGLLNWSLFDLQPGDAYVASLAASNLPSTVQCWAFHGAGDLLASRVSPGLAT